MKQMVVRYQAKPDRADENQALIKGVFDELHAKSIEGVRYLALRLSDNTFVHFVSIETEDGVSPLRGLEAFRQFQTDIQARTLELPKAGDVVIVGNYRMLSR